MNEVRPGLWVGDIASATSDAYLSAAGITHVVNATRMQVPYPGQRNVAQVPVDDTEWEPLLLYFGRVSQLIHQVLKDGDSILLHCQAGVSRSATLAVAYLMATERLDPDAALVEVRKKRVQADPNEGFLRQLRLYHQGQCTLDVRQKTIRRFLLSTVNTMAGHTVDDVLSSAASEGAVEFGPLPERPYAPTEVAQGGSTVNLSLSPALKVDISSLPEGPGNAEALSLLPARREGVSPAPPSSAQGDVGPVLRCKKCRRILVVINEHLIDHDPGEAQGAFEVHRRTTPGSEQAGAHVRAPSAESTAAPTGQAGSAAALSASLPPQLAALRLGRPAPAPGRGLGNRPMPRIRMPTFLSPRDVLPSDACGAFFVEPLKWMTPELGHGELKGRIDCPAPKCGAKLGSYDWAGSQCGCGSWITPAFALHVSKVDIEA